MSVVRRVAKIEEAPLQKELLLFNPASSQFYLLNQTMAFVWRHCDGKTPDALVTEMAGAFEGAEKTVMKEDVRKALVELESLGLVQLDATEKGA